MNKLSILIPTYNREERLLRLLKRLYSQGHWGEYNLIISDNHSDYDVMSCIRKEFEEDFYKNIEYHSNGFNTGLGANISFPFTYIKTDWCLFLSDDDEIADNMLERIIEDVNNKENENISAIKYSTEGLDIHEDNFSFSSIEEFTNYYLNRERGDRWYLVMLYNMVILKQYCYYFTVYSYSCLSFLIPVIYSLIEKTGTVKVSSFRLIKYSAADGDAWYSKPESYLKTLVCARTIFDINWPISAKSKKQLNKMIADGHFNSRKIVVLLLKLSKQDDRKHYYSLLHNYMFDPWPKRVMYKIVYHILYSFSFQIK